MSIRCCLISNCMVRLCHCYTVLDYFLSRAIEAFESPTCARLGQSSHRDLAANDAASRRDEDNNS
jgi:hypothetical protein